MTELTLWVLFGFFLLSDGTMATPEPAIFPTEARCEVVKAGHQTRIEQHVDVFIMRCEKMTITVEPEGEDA